MKITAIVKLDDQNHRQLWVPKGFAHGYLVLSETAVFAYKCDNYYATEYGGGMMWNEPALKIDWLLPEEDQNIRKKIKATPCCLP